jgi:PI-3-kinase-related kinase SMG-1
MAPANSKNPVPPPVPRPSDMFYGKIIPALKEKGIRRVISRRDWPHDVKRKVLLDLIKEVPRQLLHQELWCASEGFKAFSSKLRRYLLTNLENLSQVSSFQVQALYIIYN